MLGIINYGSGNIKALANICDREKIAYRIIKDASELSSCSHFLLPGVGAFDPTISILNEVNLVNSLQEEVAVKNKPIMGICVGMHLLGNGSDEGRLSGLGWIPGHVLKIDTSHLKSPPLLPHMGWNSVECVSDDPLLEGVDLKKGFYFLHSYFFCADDNADVVATFSYGCKMPCIVRKNNVIGAQFHPEKSHSNGIKLIRNFALSK